MKRYTDEEKLEGMEEKRQDALEMEKEENEKRDESPPAEEMIVYMMGAWCSQASSRAPVRG